MKTPIYSQLPALLAELFITLLGLSALHNGINGAIFATTIAALAGLGGYQIRQNHTNIDK